MNAEFQTCFPNLPVQEQISYPAIVLPPTRLHQEVYLSYVVKVGKSVGRILVIITLHSTMLALLFSHIYVVVDLHNFKLQIPEFFTSMSL